MAKGFFRRILGQKRALVPIRIAEFRKGETWRQRRRINLAARKSKLLEAIKEIAKKQPTVGELRELHRELKKSSPIWGKINRIEPKLREAHAGLKAVLNEIESFLSDFGYLLNKRTRESFQDAKNKAVASIGVVEFLLGEIKEKRAPKPAKAQQQGDSAAGVQALLAKIRGQIRLKKA